MSHLSEFGRRGFLGSTDPFQIGTRQRYTEPTPKSSRNSPRDTRLLELFLNLSQKKNFD